jgi:hypothetical protein
MVAQQSSNLEESMREKPLGTVEEALHRITAVRKPILPTLSAEPMIQN